MTRVGIYCRISEDDAGDAAGVQRQEEDCRARVAREPGWEIVDVFVDNDISATAKANKVRPRWNALVGYAERGELDVILATRTNRLTRDIREKEDLIALSIRTGVRVCTTAEGDESYEHSSGRTVSRLKGVIAADEAERISENVKRAVRQRVDRGRSHGGQRPFGYGVDTGRSYFRKGEERPVYDTAKAREPEFTALREGILAVTQGASVRSVALAWDAAGLYPTGRALTWASNLTSTRNALTRWRNAGVRVYQGQPVFDAPPACEPCVSIEELRELLEHLDDRGRRMNRGRVAQRALLGSLITCGVCHSYLRSSTHEISKYNHTRVGTYRCHPNGCTTIRRAQIDELVVNATIVELMSSDLTVHADSTEDRVRLRWLRAKKTELEEEAVQLAAERGNGEITKSQFMAINAGLQRRVTATEAEWREIGARFALADWVQRERTILDLSDDDRDTATAAEFERFEAQPLHRRREIVRRLFTIIVNSGRGADRIVIVPRATGIPVTHSWSALFRVVPGGPPASADADDV